MQWVDHRREVPEGSHAPFSASKYTWIRYTDHEEFRKARRASFAQQVGTALHELAAFCITHRIKVNSSALKVMIPLYLCKARVPRWIFDVHDDAVDNLMKYINDAIGFGMDSEKVLYASEYFYGTTDAIYFSPDKRILRIHDLKTGTTPAKLDQLMVYAAFFCLEYGSIYDFKPEDLDIHLRIYQGGEKVTARVNSTTPENLAELMNIMEQIEIETSLFRELEEQ